MSWGRVRWALGLLAVVVVLFLSGGVFENSLDGGTGRAWWAGIPGFLLPWIGAELYLRATTRPDHRARVVSMVILVVAVGFLIDDRMQETFSRAMWTSLPKAAWYAVWLLFFVRQMSRPEGPARWNWRWGRWDSIGPSEG